MGYNLVYLIGLVTIAVWWCVMAYIVGILASQFLSNLKNSRLSKLHRI